MPGRISLRDFNYAPLDTVVPQVRGWAAVTEWADALVAARPYDSVGSLVRHADSLATGWTGQDLAEALAHHPRIGEPPVGPDPHARASRVEQNAIRGADESSDALIAQANAEYERRFGRVFLIRAAGRSAAEIVSEARRRLGNDASTELAESLGQLREIALLRIRRDLDGRDLDESAAPSDTAAEPAAESAQ